MKKHIIIHALLCIFLFSFVNASSQTIKTEKIATLDMLVDARIMAGTKTIFPIKGGDITGNINGKLLPIGGDFGTLSSPTTFELDGKAVIETSDGATIYVTYSGYIHADTATFAKLFNYEGKNISPDKYYFRITPKLETHSLKYAWLNHSIFIGIGVFTGTGVRYTFYAVK